MPALAGIVYQSTFHVDKLIDKMLDILSHRGGGDYETFHYKNIVLGANANSCCYNATKSAWIAIDGDIYNQEAIVEELEKNHHPIKDAALLPTLIKAYEVWGPNFAKKLNGTFAITLFDKTRQTLLIIRDQMGVKPMYWAHYNQNFIFASEQKAILTTGMIPRAPSKEALGAYLFFGHIPQDMTPVKEMNRLLPGCYLQATIQQNLMIRPYWSFAQISEKKIDVSAQEVEETLNNLLIKVITRRINNQPNASCLALGGLGSSSICHYLSQIMGSEKILGLSGAYENENIDDSNIAKQVFDTLKIKNEIQILKPEDLLQELSTIIWYLDQPIADPNVILTWRLAKQAKQFSPLIFSGMGSDELLAGNLVYASKQYRKSFLHALSLPLRSLIRTLFVPIIGTVSKDKAFTALRALHQSPEAMAYLKHRAIFDTKSLSEAAPRLGKTFSPSLFLQKFYRHMGNTDPKASFLYLDAEMILTDRYLRQYESLTTANGLNWHAPFLDLEIVRYLMQVPDTLKIQHNETALPLRNILTPIFPQEVLNRKKNIRFDIFTHYLNQPALQELFQLLPSGVLVDAGYLSRRYIKTLLNNKHTVRNHFQCLWSLLVLEIWFRLFINQPINKNSIEMPLNALLSY